MFPALLLSFVSSAIDVLCTVILDSGREATSRNRGNESSMVMWKTMLLCGTIVVERGECGTQFVVEIDLAGRDWGGQKYRRYLELASEKVSGQGRPMSPSTLR